MATPVWIATGCPMASTRIAPTTHCPVTHGPPDTGGNGQPATTYGAAMVATGWPLTSTRATGAVGIAWPPCAHSTVAPKWRIGPGIAVFSFAAWLNVEPR